MPILQTDLLAKLHDERDDLATKIKGLQAFNLKLQAAQTEQSMIYQHFCQEQLKAMCEYHKALCYRIQLIAAENAPKELKGLYGEQLVGFCNSIL